MSDSTTFQGNLIIGGTLKVAGGIVFAVNSLNGTAINPASPVPTASQTHQHTSEYSEPNATTHAAIGDKVLHACRGNGTIKELAVGTIGLCTGTAAITIDLKKNGTTVLTGVLTLNSSNTAKLAVAASLGASLTFVSGDVLEIVTTASAGSGAVGTGFFCRLTVDEDAIL